MLTDGGINGIGTHFAFRLPGEGHPVVPGGPGFVFLPKGPHKSGFDADSWAASSGAIAPLS